MACALRASSNIGRYDYESDFYCQVMCPSGARCFDLISSRATNVWPCDLAKPAEKQFKVWDTKTPGFGIIVGSTTKSWFAVYGRARKFKAIGRYPEM